MAGAERKDADGAIRGRFGYCLGLKIEPFCLNEDAHDVENNRFNHRFGCLVRSKFVRQYSNAYNYE
jgi:hypothetical protein